MPWTLPQYAAWEKEAREAALELARQYLSSPPSSEAECRAALSRLPAHPVMTHFFEPPFTRADSPTTGPSQFVATVLGSLAIRYRDNPTLRISQAQYRTHIDGVSTRAAPCYLLEITTHDGTLASCVVDASLEGGALRVTVGTVCRARYGWWRLLKWWSPFLVFGVSFFLLCLMCGGFPFPMFCIGIPLVLPGIGIGIMMRWDWPRGVVYSSDTKPMPADGANFVRLVLYTAAVLADHQPAEVLREACLQTGLGTVLGRSPEPRPAPTTTPAPPTPAPTPTPQRPPPRPSLPDPD